MDAVAHSLPAGHSSAFPRFSGEFSMFVKEATSVQPFLGTAATRLFLVRQSQKVHINRSSLMEGGMGRQRGQQDSAVIPSVIAKSQINGAHLRRSMLSMMSAMIAAAASPPATAAPMPMMVEADLPRFRRTSSGVKIQEVVEGAGPEANNGDLVEFNYVCRRSNGYFVYSTVDQFNGESEPVVLPLGEGKIIAGLEEVIMGMKPGGKRRALVPPAVGYVDTSLEPQPHEWVSDLQSHFRSLGDGIEFV